MQEWHQLFNSTLMRITASSLLVESPTRVSSMICSMDIWPPKMLHSEPTWVVSVMYLDDRNDMADITPEKLMTMVFLLSTIMPSLNATGEPSHPRRSILLHSPSQVNVYQWIRCIVLKSDLLHNSKASWLLAGIELQLCSLIITRVWSMSTSVKPSEHLHVGHPNMVFPSSTIIVSSLWSQSPRDHLLWSQCSHQCCWESYPGHPRTSKEAVVTCQGSLARSNWYFSVVIRCKVWCPCSEHGGSPKGRPASFWFIQEDKDWS